MKHFIQFDENGEVQFVIRAEFDAVIADENKNRFIEVTEAQAEEISKACFSPSLEVKKNSDQYIVSGGKVIKKPVKPVKPAENVLLPTIDQLDILK